MMATRTKQLWLACVWALVAGCESEAGRADEVQPVEEDGAVEGAGDARADAAPAVDARVNEANVDAGQPRERGEDASAQPKGDVTWCDVEPITRKNCVTCHKTGGVGPMKLDSHADFTAVSEDYPNSKVYQRTGVRIHDTKAPMPSTGMLKSEDLALLDAWIAAGAPSAPAEGCDEQPVEPVPTEVPWPTNCDATYRILAHAPSGATDPYQVPPGKEIHPRIDVDAPWGDEEVQAIAFRPITDNEQVLHHWILYGSDRTFLTGWAPGGDGIARLRDDVGMYMPKGKASMYLDMHYFNLTGGSVQSDRSGVEICVLKKEHFRPNTASVAHSFGSIGGTDFVLAPAGAKDHAETGVCTVTTTQPVHLLSASPHAHTYATHMKFTVQKKDGREIVMHDEPFFFHAQGSYALKEDVVLETGDKVITTCSYTNDTTKNINVGESTTDEMCFNFAVYYPKDAFTCSGWEAQLLENI